MDSRNALWSEFYHIVGIESSISILDSKNFTHLISIGEAEHKFSNNCIKSIEIRAHIVMGYPGQSPPQVIIAAFTLEESKTIVCLGPVLYEPIFCEENGTCSNKLLRRSVRLVSFYYFSFFNSLIVGDEVLRMKLNWIFLNWIRKIFTFYPLVKVRYILEFLRNRPV